MSKGKTARRSRRLNRRALVTLAALTVAAAAGLVGLKLYQDAAGRKAYLVEARKRVEQKRNDLALGYLNRYLEARPNDLEALRLKAQILSDPGANPSQAQEAAKLLSQVVDSTPKGKERLETRKRLVDLVLKMGNPDWYPTAENQAKALIETDGAKDAESYRLYAQSLERVGYFQKKTEKLNEARKYYEKAGAEDPQDVATAEQLAALCRERLHDRDKAQAVLDTLVARTAKDPAKHAAALLARFRHHYAVLQDSETSPDDRAKALKAADADVVAAVKDAPSDLEARLAAASLAIQAPRFDTADARLHLAAIPEERRNSLRVKYLEGMIGLVERRPEDAIQAWRAGLVMTGGTDDRLTAGLAELLLESGRVSEALPLIDQFHRLTGGEAVNPHDRDRHDANDARYHYLHGLALLKESRLREAIAELETIQYKSAKDVDTGRDQANRVYYALGQAYEGIRETSKALDAYRRAAELSQDWSTPWTALARLQSQSKADDAEQTLRRGLALMPNDPKLVTALAEVLWRQQMQKPEAERSWSEIQRLLDDARKRDPGSVTLALVEADYYTARRQPDDAIELLEQASRQNPQAPELWLALANALARRGRLAKALDAIDRAESPKAAGPHAALAVTRASLLTVKGQVADARQALVSALERVPASEKPALWKTLGDFYLAQKDYASARASYDQWSRLAPSNPEPRMSLFQLALATNDDEAIARAVDDLKKTTSPESYYWRYARVEDLLRDRPKDTDDEKRRRLDEAQALVKEVQKNDPLIPLGYILEAKTAEKAKRVDEAIAAYKKALERKAGAAALNPLVALLVRENRDDELRRLRADYNGDSEFDRLAAVQALAAGNKGRAEELAEQAVLGDPKGLDVRLWRAEVLKSLGKPEEAEKALRSAIAQQPSVPAPWLSLLMLQLSQKKTADAAATVEQIRSQVKSDTKELLMAQCYRAVGNTQKADESYREALKKSPNDPSVSASAVSFYEQIGRREEAESLLRALRRHDPSNAWAARKLALSLAHRAGNRAAWEEALSLVGAEPRPDDVPDDKIARADVYARGPEPGHRAKAVAILEGLLAEMPTLPKVHEQVARILFATGDVAKARGHAAEAASASGATPDTILFYAGVLLAANDLDGAEAQLKRLAAIEPDGLPVAELKAKILAARGKADEGAAVLEKAFADRAKAPDAPAVGASIVSLLSTPPLKNLEAAERVARAVAALGPAGRCVLAEVLAARGKADEAAAELTAAAKAGESARAGAVALSLAARPPADKRWRGLAESFLASAGDPAEANPDRLLQRALLLHLKGDFAEEVAVYERLIALHPSNYQFLNNLAWTLSEEMKKPEDGLKWIDEAIKRVGPVPDLLDTRGVILTRLGRLDDAVKALETAAGQKKDATVDYHLARAYHKQGNADAARKHRDRAREAGLTREQLQPCDQADWDAVMK